MGTGHSFFSYPLEVRKMIYTAHAIESLHRQLRKIVKNRGHFPNDQAAKQIRHTGAHPSPNNRLCPRTIDRHLYKARNLLERTFNWIKHFLCVATRFETLDFHDAAIVSISCICMPRLIENTT